MATLVGVVPGLAMQSHVCCKTYWMVKLLLCIDVEYVLFSCTGIANHHVLKCIFNETRYCC